MKSKILSRVALITGATGFVGSHLVRGLLLAGWEVHAIVRNKSGIPDDTEYSLVNWHPYNGEQDSLNEIVEQVKPSVVFHLASLFLSEHTSEDVGRLIGSNILFGAQLLEAMKVAGVHELINTGTSWQHYNNYDYCPVNLYAATKQAFEDIVKYYVDAQEFRVITLKLFDTYGSHDPRKKLFAMLMDATHSEKQLNMSLGEQLIDIVYIDDVVRAYLIAADRLSTLPKSTCESFSVSSNHPIPLRQLVDVFKRECNFDINFVWGAREYRNREVMIPWNRGQPLPGWTPLMKLSDGIQLVLSTNSELN